MKKKKGLSPKHIITAKDKKTGKLRTFIFEGELFSNLLIVEEVEEEDTTKNCFLEYDEDGYLVCSFNHKIGDECLMKGD